jgi:hypothetical protein
MIRQIDALNIEMDRAGNVSLQFPNHLPVNLPPEIVYALYLWFLTPGTGQRLEALDQVRQQEDDAFIDEARVYSEAEQRAQRAA